MFILMLDEAPVYFTLYDHRAFSRNDFIGQIPNFKRRTSTRTKYCIRILGSGRKVEFQFGFQRGDICDLSWTIVAPPTRAT
jgi:hypothetical protein